MKCFFCSEDYSDIKDFIGHLRKEEKNNGKISEFPCICGKQYMTFDSFRAHLKKNACINSASNPQRILTEQETLNQNPIKNVYNETTDVITVHIDAMNDDGDAASEIGAAVTISNGETGTSHRPITECLEPIKKAINELKLNETTTNTIYDVICEVIDKSYGIYHDILVDSCGLDELNHFEATKSYIIQYFNRFNTQFKRERDLNANELYVKPQERAIGAHLQMKMDKQTGRSLPVQVQSKFYTISIKESLEKLFARGYFKDMYMDYNMTTKHKCLDGKYIDFCCGRKFSENGLFKNDPTAVQLQLFIDGFEPCDGMKTKTHLHTQDAVYFAIRNVPQKFAYNLDNIHLVALCNSNDIKTKHTDYNDIWEFIVKDVKAIESEGIKIDDNTYVKGNI